MRHSVVLSAAFAAVSLAARALAQDAAEPVANSSTAPASDAVAVEASTAPAVATEAAAESLEAAAKPVPHAAEYVLAERPEALRGLSRVAITSFAVEYMTFLEAKTEGNWGNLIGNKPNDVSVKMVGQDPSGWQAVVDAFYDQLVADLEAAGIEVVPQERVRAAARYSAIAKAAETVPREVSGRAGKGMYYGARELPVLIQDEAAVFKRGFQLGKPPEDLYMGVGTKIAAGFATAGAMNAEHALAKELGAHVLKVRLTVLPTQVSADHSFWVGGHVTTRAAVSLVPFVNRYLLYGPDGKDARLSLAKDLVSENAAGELVDTTSAASKAGQVAGVGLRVFGALSGISTPGAVGKSKDYEFRIDNAAYPTAVADTLTTAHQLFLQQLLAARSTTAHD